MCQCQRAMSGLAAKVAAPSTPAQGPANVRPRSYKATQAMAAAASWTATTAPSPSPVAWHTAINPNQRPAQRKEHYQGQSYAPEYHCLEKRRVLQHPGEGRLPEFDVADVLADHGQAAQMHV